MNTFFINLIIAFIISTASVYSLEKEARPPLQEIANTIRAYNPSTIQTVEGIIQEVRRVDRLGTRDYGLNIQITTANEGDILVRVGPKWYLDEQNLSLQVGDAIQVKGSRLSNDRHPTIIASTIKKDYQTVHLRDDYGIPKWNKKNGYFQSVNE